MKLHKNKQFFKQIIFLSGVLIVTFSILLFSNIISEMEKNAEENFKFQVEVFQTLLASNNPEDVTFLFQKMIKNTSYPVIYTDAEKVPIYWVNLPEENLTKEHVQQFVEEFTAYMPPIAVKFQENILGYYCYGEPLYLQELKWLPYISLILAVTLVVIAFMGFRNIQKTEIQHLWVGMSKETAHQLGTPISSLFGWIELLKSTPEMAPSAIPELEKDIKRLKTVGQRFGKIGSKPNLVPLEMNTLLDEVFEYYRPRMGKHIKLTRKTGPPTEILGDKELLFWVIENLIRNAIDAIRTTNGTIHIESYSTEKRLRLTVEDNGIGMTAAQAKHVFDAGFSTKKRGWGLGLSLSKRIVEEYHRGKLHILKTEPEKGTTFNVELPLKN